MDIGNVLCMVFFIIAGIVVFSAVFVGLPYYYGNLYARDKVGFWATVVVGTAVYWFFAYMFLGSHYSDLNFACLIVANFIAFVSLHIGRSRKEMKFPSTSRYDENFM